ncbi:MAG TPA: adenylate/guanylate cyclase domain-containing protein [Candidatus Limnocylindria bacterium]|jgi:adenylate cyclase|nr:adenylate/guanylate cyclase domain-containing protein [Candidatus Limnocylindria bacterium]
MAELTRAQAAGKAGAEPQFVDRLIELRILVPDEQDRLTISDVRRIQMARTLEGSGIGLEAIAAGLESGRLSLRFMDTPAYQRFATLSEETFSQVSARTGVPLELLTIAREATGGAMPEPEDRVREDELVIVPYLRALLDSGITPRSVERQLRVLGDGMRRLAETQGDAWRTDLMEPLLRRGATVRDIEEASVATGTEDVEEAADPAILAVWHANQAQAWGANIITGFETILADAGLLTMPSSPPAICFLDITGYTRLTQEHGDEAAADLAASLNRLVTRTSRDRGGRPVKWLGDGVMVHFREPGRGVLAALEMVAGVDEVGLPPAHVGLHAGPVLFQEGDYFGRTVNIASRIAEYARPGEVLVTREVVQESAGSGCRFTEIGPVELKGVQGAVELHAAHMGS